MKRAHRALLAVATLCLWGLAAAPAQAAERGSIVRQGTSGTTYSEEVPVLARVQGTAFFRTLVAFVNNTNKGGVVASYQFSYTCVAAACSPVGGFYRTAVQNITLKALDSFVQDDFIQYLFTQGLLQPGAEQGSIGTLLVTFETLPTSNGYAPNVV